MSGSHSSVLPHVLIVGKPSCGKTTLVESLREKYGRTNIQPLSVLDWVNNKSPITEESGCLLEDGDGSGVPHKLVESGMVDIVIELDVPDEICVRWLEKKLEPNKQQPLTSEREKQPPDSPFAKAMFRKIALFNENYEKNVLKYDSYPAIFVRVNGYGEKNDVFAIVESFVEASIAQRCGKYQDAILKYAEAAKVSAKLHCKEGVAAACCGQGKAFLSLNKLTKAHEFLDNAQDLMAGSEPGSIGGWANLARGIIKKKLDAKKAKLYFQELELQAKAKEAAEARKKIEKQEWIQPLHNAIKAVEEKKVKLLKNKKEADEFASNFVSFEEQEKQRLRAKYKAYTRDLTKKELVEILASRIAPKVVRGAVEIGLSKILFKHESFVQERKREQMELNRLMKRRQAKAAKVRRITMMQEDRKGRINKVIRTAKCPSEACESGVPLIALKRVVREDMERTISWFRRQQRKRMGRRVEDDDDDEEEEDDFDYMRKPRHTISRNDVFEQLCTNTNAMVVESMHPYKPSSCHVVELTPNETEGVQYGSDSGLAIVFHHHCDINSGNAEIRFFADSTCTIPLGNETYTTRNLPSVEEPLFIKANSVVMMFKSRDFDAEYNNLFFSSWGWKMAIVKAESLSSFHHDTMERAINAAALKAVIQGDDNCFSAAVFARNFQALEYLLHLGKQFVFDINRKDALTGTTLLHDAARVGDYEILKYLLDHGADRDVKNFQSETPLFFATRLNHTRCVKLLVYQDERARMVKKMEVRTRRISSPLMSTPIKKQMMGNLRSLDNKVRGILSTKNHRGRTPMEIASIRKGVSGGRGRGGKKGKNFRPVSAPMFRKNNPVLISLLDANEMAIGGGGRPKSSPAVRGRVRPRTAGAVRRKGMEGGAKKRPNTAKISGRKGGIGGGGVHEGFSTPVRKERPQTAS